jgi:hypothetical protein
MPTRALSEPIYARLDNGALLPGLLNCFVTSPGVAALASVDFVTTWEPKLVPTTEPPSNVRVCLEARIRAMPLDTEFERRVRVVARLRAMRDAPAWSPDLDGSRAVSLHAEIAVLDRITGAADVARARAARRLLAIRYVDASLATTDANVRAKHLARAEELFVASAAEDTVARPSALFSLATALGYANERARAQTPLRSLVCASRFPFAPGPPPARPASLPQDHPPEYWDAWTNDAWKKRRAAETAHTRAAKPRAKAAVADETIYVSPYEGCAPGASDRSVSYAEAWFAIGAFHEGLDSDGGAMHWNRAATAYGEAIAAAKGEPSSVLPFARLALARTLFAQQRYAAAVREAVALLDSRDVAGAPELLERAAQLIATSLSHVDLTGPPEDAPFLVRPDVFDVEPNPAVVATKLHVAIERAMDPSLLPQDRPWTPEVVFWLAKDLRSAVVPRIEIEADELFLARWPLHRDAPIIQSDEIDAWDEIARETLPTKPEHAEAIGKLADARQNLVKIYAGETAWARANAADAAAIATAGALVEAVKGAHGP